MLQLNTSPDSAHAVTVIITDTIAKTGSASWDEITTTIKAQYTVKNWLTAVRGPLQGLLDQGIITRWPDVKVEVYTLTPGGKTMTTPKQAATNLAADTQIAAIITAEATKAAGKPLPAGIVKKSTSYNIDPTRITPREGWNNRFDYGDIESLAQGIKSTLAMCPDRPYASDIEVKRLAASDPLAANFDFEIVAGHRRVAATLLLLKKGVVFPHGVNAHLVDRAQDDKTSLILMFSENNAKPLLPLEEAAALKRMRDLGMTIKEICKAVGRADVHVTDTLALLEADASLKDAVKDGTVGATVAKQIAVVAKGDKAKQAELTKDAVDAGKDKVKRRAVIAKIDATKVAKAAAKGKVLKIRALTDDQLSEIGSKLAKHLLALLKEAKLDAALDLAAWVKQDEKLAVAYTSGALAALRAAAGEKISLEV